MFKRSFLGMALPMVVVFGVFVYFDYQYHVLHAPDLSLSKDDLRLAVNLWQQKNRELEALQKELDELRDEIRNPTVSNEVCDLYERFNRFADIQFRYQNGGFEMIGDHLLGLLDNEVKLSAQTVSSKAYQIMKSGTNLGCGGSRLPESAVVENISAMMDAYGGLDGEKFDPQIIRLAMRRSVRFDKLGWGK